MIKAKTFNNCSCLKCGCTNNLMIKIGVFTMCVICFHEEFEYMAINPKSDSKDIEKYRKWLKIYKNAF